MTKLLNYGPLGFIKPALISLFKLGLIAAILTGLMSSEVCFGAAPVPTSSRRHPPHNGSMFGKRSNLMPILGWSQSNQLQQPQISPFGPIITQSVFPTESLEYQAETYPGRLSTIIGTALDQCIRELRQLGELLIIRLLQTDQSNLTTNFNLSFRSIMTLCNYRDGFTQSSLI